MAKTTFADKNKIDLDKLLLEKEAALASFRFSGAGAKATDVKAGRNLRKEIAQIKTFLKLK